MTSDPSALLNGNGAITDSGRRRAVLIATCLALMAVIASVTGLNVAQQEVAIDLGASQSTVLWIINAYTVALGAMLLPIGAIGDRWGRRPVLLAGLVLFVAATATSALAPTSATMIAARLISGVAAAMIMPVTLSVITSSFPEEERSQAIGVWTAVAGGGGLLGMFASALFVDLVSWRWLFAPPIILAVLAFTVAARSVPNSREETDAPFDIGGSLLAMVAVGGLVLGIHDGPVHGWTEPFTIAVLLVGGAAAVGFGVWELRQENPLLNVRAFRDRRLASGSTALLAIFGVLGGIFVVLFPFFQAVLGWSALRSTVGMLPMAVGMMLSSGLAPKVAAKLGLKLTMLVGLGFGAAGLALMATMVSVEGRYLSVLPGMLVMAAGIGLAMTPSTEAITAALPAERQGVASALNDATREIGTSLGIASLGAVLTAGYRQAINTDLAAYPAEIADAVSEGIGTAYAAAGQTSDGPAIIASAQQAFVEGWSQSMWVGVGVFGVLFLGVLLRGPVPTRGELLGDKAEADAATTAV